MSIPNYTGTNGALVVPLSREWNQGAKAAPEQNKKANLYPYSILTGSIQTVPIYPHMETAAADSPTSQRPTVLNPLDFMRGNPYE